MPAVTSLSRFTSGGGGTARRAIGPPPTTPNYGELERQRASDLAANARDFGLAGHVTDPNTGAYYSTGGGGASGGGAGSGGTTRAPTGLTPPSEPDDFYGDYSKISSLFPGATTVAPPPPQVPQIGPIDTSAAQAAAFARAKDQVGQTAGGAIRSLRSVAGARGMLGSGSEGRQTADVINRGQGELGDVSRSQAIDSASLAQDTAKFNYTGAVSQRSTDMNDTARRREQQLAENNSRFSQIQALLSLKRARKPSVSAVSY